MAFEGKSDSEVENFLFGQGFIKVRKIDDGSWIGILPLNSCAE